MEDSDQRLTDALTNLRGPVQQILKDGDDPSDVLELGMLVRRRAPETIDLAQLCEALSNSSLSEVVGDVAFSIQRPDGEEPDADDFDELPEEDEPDLLGEN